VFVFFGQMVTGEKLQKMLVKLTTVVNFINIFLTLFLPIFWRQTISNLKHSFVIFGAKMLAQNAHVKC